MSGAPPPIQCRCRQGYGHSGRGLKFHKTISKKVHFQVFIFLRTIQNTILNTSGFYISQKFLKNVTHPRFKGPEYGIYLVCTLPLCTGGLGLTVILSNIMKNMEDAYATTG